MASYLLGAQISEWSNFYIVSVLFVRHTSLYKKPVLVFVLQKNKISSLYFSQSLRAILILFSTFSIRVSLKKKKKKVLCE